MAHVAVTLEGGLFAADLLERIAATPDAVEGQRAKDFALEGKRLGDVIQGAFSDVRSYWDAFTHRRERAPAERITTVTRDAWMLPFFEAMEYDLPYQQSAAKVGDMTFAISHRAGREEGAPPVHIVAWDRPLDRRDGQRMSPHALVQDYLNRSDALWGIVTNGRVLRLLRHSERTARPSYLEFDLQGIVEGNQYSAFVLLFRLLHRSRLPRGAEDAGDSLLERWFRQGIEEGGRVRERLRDGVKKALEVLGAGFLENPQSAGLHRAFAEDKLTAAQYYRQLLRLIYRLLFLMVAEERKLLLAEADRDDPRQRIYADWYSVGRLRERAEARRRADPHGDLWEGLKQTFRLFRGEKEAASLGLAALDGELFGAEACHDLERHAALRNDVLLSAVYQLSTFEEEMGRRGKKTGIRRRVNYAALDVEEFGSVYESLLDYHPDVALEPPGFALVAGSERKTTGSYYTPPALVHELIESALVPVMEARLAEAKTPAEKEAALLSLRVCDPAAGSGHFLLAAARRIGKALAAVRTGEPEPAPAPQREAMRDVIRRCLYAVDKNPLAVDLCKVALWIEGHSPGLPLGFLDHHVKCGDSLIGVFDLTVLGEGVPDAAYKPVGDDDKPAAREYAKRNRSERKRPLFRFAAEDALHGLAARFAALTADGERSPADVQAKAEAYRRLRESPEWSRLRTAADLWTAAFFVPKREKGAGPETIPTTSDVWRALDGGAVQGPMAATVDRAAARQGFFHAPLEFPDVFDAGGFDVVLGNPPWERVKQKEKEFFASRSRKIADAPNKAARERLIAALRRDDALAEEKALAAEFAAAKYEADAASLFVRGSGRFPLTAVGDVNTYALFAENFLRMVQPQGKAGLIVPTGIATDSSTKAFFEEVVSKRRLVSLFDFENREGIFVSVHRSYKFCLLTLGSDVKASDFAFFLTNTGQLRDEVRHFTLSADDIALINPNTRTCPIFRSQADAELTKKIYQKVPILVDLGSAEQGNRWDITLARMFHSSDDSYLFKTHEYLAKTSAKIERNLWHGANGETWVPLYEQNMVHIFDHRFASYEGDVEVQLSDDAKADVSTVSYPKSWVEKAEISKKGSWKAWLNPWLLCWRRNCRSNDVRTLICSFIPAYAAADGLFFILPNTRAKKEHILVLAGVLNSLVVDWVLRQKLGGTNLSYYYLEQIPIICLDEITGLNERFICSRVVELSYTSEELRAFATWFGFDGQPFGWNPDRRSLLRAELDAYYAYLYGLTRRELEYVLDPYDVMGADYPSETFRVLKNNEMRAFGEYRTRRLVLEAWDRFSADGTFKPRAGADVLYIDKVSAELAETKKRLEELEASYRTLLAKADASKLPALFVEGLTDAAILRAAWRELYPGEAMPFTIIPAEGTKNLGSLAGKGKALRELLGDRLVCVLADNDSSGRELVEDGHVRKGGAWRQLPNGIHWCLLAPTDEFRAVMEQAKIPANNWPCTVEACFPAALRRQAMEAGAYRFSGNLQSEIFDNKDLAQRLFPVAQGLNPTDDAYFYLMAPHHEAKETFAEWLGRPENLNRDTFAAFALIFDRLRDLLAARSGSEDAIPSKARRAG